MASIEELVAAVWSALETLAKGKTLAARGEAARNDAQAAFSGISRGSHNYRPIVAVEALTAVIESAARAQVVSADAIRQRNGYLSSIGARPRRSSPPANPRPAKNRKRPALRARRMVILTITRSRNASGF